MGKLDYVILPYTNFKDKIRVHKELDREMVKKHGRNNFSLTVLDNCIMASFKSINTFF
ncbi:MAG TPA: hypothetical protein VIM70_11545 [Clostridium sp.]|uniref:hypothetical protein n=1 Tax=Clostridium sp. TaxID=1506 RepID=UPI002F9489D5